MGTGPVTSAWRLEVGSALPAGVVGEIHRRYGPVAVAARGRRTVLERSTADQAALRALMTLLWDLNIEVLHLEVLDPTLDGSR